jgi:uncharacterized peroxidase-related enzyme
VTIPKAAGRRHLIERRAESGPVQPMLEIRMSRIPTPATIADAPAESQPLLEAVQKQLGSTPNLFRIVANSPAALEGFLGLNGALARGRLPAPTRERIALAVAEINGCGYCLAAHAYLAKNLVKLSAEEIAANRRGQSADPTADAAVRFAAKLASGRGRVEAEDIAVLRAAGYDDGQIVEVIAHVALNTLTNYMNVALATEVDFPVLEGVAA